MVQPGQNGNLPLAENIYGSKDLMVRNITQGVVSKFPD
jgi:hypothetical protein